MAVDYKQLTKAYARKWGIPEALAVAQIGQESGFNPRAVSSAGAQGLAQFMPATARGVGLRDPFNPQQSLDAYGKHMSTLLKNYKGNVRLALAAYNAGGGAVSKYGNKVPPYRETQEYVKRIMAASGGGMPTPGTTKGRKRPPGGTGVPAPGQPAGVQQGPQATLQASDATFKLINKWLAAEDAAFASGKPSDPKLWNQVLRGLQQSPLPAPQVAGGGVTVPGRPASRNQVGAATAATSLAGAPATTQEANGVVGHAKKWLGTPYSWGGGTPKGPGRGIGRGANTVGFDCSSLMQYAWSKMGVNIPRVTYDQAKIGANVSATKRNQWAPGDLLFSRPGSRGPEHVRMYIGNGKAIQAPRTGGKVEIIDVPSDVYIVRRPTRK